MPLFRTCPFEDLVVRATSENNINDDWALIMEIVDKAVNYDEGSKLILQAITKRLYNSVPRVVVQALMLLDSCIKNCGRRFHLEVASKTFVAEIRKLLQKMCPTAIDKFKCLIKRWAELDFKDDPELGLIPSLYYKLKSEGVHFPEEKVEAKPLQPPPCTNPDAVSSQEEEEDIVKAIALSLKETEKSSSLSINSIYDFKSLDETAVKQELVKVRALYDFDAVEDNELTIRAGEIVVVTDKSNESWWKGSNQRGEGYFPVSFVTEDLDAPIEQLKINEDTSKTEEEEVDDSAIVIDEQKIHKTLQILNDIDPTDDFANEHELLNLERQCYSMSPLIDEKLHEIDRRCTLLNSLNNEIMEAIQTFNKLMQDSLAPAQFGYYYNVPFPSDGSLANQSLRESGPSNATSISANQQKPGIPGNFFIPPNYLPNLVPLTTDQIRQNVVGLPFIHPQYLPIQYSMLAQKLNADVNHVSSEAPTFSNPVQTTTIPQSHGLMINSVHHQSQPLTINSVNHQSQSLAISSTNHQSQPLGISSVNHPGQPLGINLANHPSQSLGINSVNHPGQPVAMNSINPQGNSINHKEQKTLGSLDTENFAAMSQTSMQELPAPLTQNVPSTANNSTAAAIVTNHSNAFQMQNYTIPQASATTNVINYSQNIPLSGMVIPTTNIAANLVLSNNVSSNERLVENGVQHQNGQ